MSLLDAYLYYDEDHDISEDEMPEWTTVDPEHLIELHQRGLLAERDVFSHKGWHHNIQSINAGNYVMAMWDGPSGEEYLCNYARHGNTWD